MINRIEKFYSTRILVFENWIVTLLSKGIVRFRWLVILLTFLSLGIIGYPILNLGFDNSNEMWFLENDPNIQAYENTNRQFGDHQVFVIGIETRSKDVDVFNLETLTAIKELSDFLEQQDFVSKVSSLTNYQYLRYEDEVIQSYDLIGDLSKWDPSPKAVSQLVEIMAGEQFIHGTLITKDLRHTVIAAKIVYINDSFDHHLNLFRDLREFIKQKGYQDQGFNIHFTGTSAIYGQLQAINERDRLLIQPIMGLVIIILLFFAFRTWVGVITPLIVVIASLITTYGFIGWMDWNLNVLNTPSLFALLIAVGVGDSIHILTEFNQFREEGLSPIEASISANRALLVPCYYTSITTCVGFLAITITRLSPLREYGVMAAVGVFSAFFYSITILPALLSFTSKMVKGRPNQGGPVRLTNALTPFTLKHSRVIMIVSLGGFLVMGLLSLNVKTDSSYKQYFKSNSTVIKDLDYFDEHYKNTGGFVIVIDTKGAKEEDFSQLLIRLGEFQDFVESFPLTGKVRSVANYIRHVNKVMHDNNPDFYKIPESVDVLNDYFKLYRDSNPRENLRDLVSLDGRYIKMEIPQKYLSSLTTTEQVKIIDAKLKEVFPDFKTVVTGEAVLDSSKDDYVIKGLTQSFSIALLIILLCFFLLLHSFKYGFIALIPCVYPIVFIGGIMSLLGIHLNFNTMIISSLTFGIAVDDTMHMMTRYARGRREGSPRKEAVHLALTDAGRAIMFTSVVLFFGFGVNLMAQFLPAIHFAILGGSIILIACLADLVLLPAMLFIIGDDTPKSISLDIAPHTE